ncbi:MAG TPA: hypothetical protein VGH89_20920 [Pseudonocardia sp.]|jgi:hypothetical protein
MNERWRIGLAVLGASGWFWMMTLPHVREYMLNPDAYGTGRLPPLIVAIVALLIVDVWAVWYIFRDTTSKPKQDADRDYHE